MRLPDILAKYDVKQWYINGELNFYPSTQRSERDGYSVLNAIVME